MTGREWKEAAAAILFPERCAYCGQVVAHKQRVCAACAAALPRIVPPACPLCGCHKQDCTCRHRQRLYDRCLSPFYYEGPVRSGVLRLKQRQRPYIVRELAGQMVRTFADSGEERPAGVVYVPMTKRQEKQRGFNQSRLLAAQVARELDLPLWDALVKIQETLPQKSLTAAERTGNVLGVFDWDPAWNRPAGSMLLVDDLVSTGATAGECAKVLKLYGAQRVVLLVAAVNRGAAKQKDATEK